ncbi:Trimethylamine:corrinoid methyltransferase [Desulforhopalus singaporensis]|uniref:Trimethylamine:corrinoid methyltransferase n=2 Tax=Desulforhopalus singaporensis TaxID=91360 RepID=A0A1H0LJK4_9BACT|nr:Trimethylamine:corrinoid methyltransferase [Desulforhopalus singaporensis]
MRPYYEMYSQEEIEMIYDAALEILADVGLEMTHPRALEMLEGAGARVDRKSNRVYFPTELTEKCLAMAPEEFTCSGRTEEFDYTAGMYADARIRTASGAIDRFDLYRNTTARLTCADIAEQALVADALPNVGCVGSLTPSDSPRQTYDIYSLRSLLENTRKNIWVLTSSSKNLFYQLKMLEAVCGSKETMRLGRNQGAGIFCVISPLTITDDEIERAMLYADYGLPVKVPITTLMGGNAPYTMAGILAQATAEFMGCTVILQTIKPGIPVWYYGLFQSLDMATGGVQYTSAELQATFAAVAQLARRCKIPPTTTCTTSSGCEAQQTIFNLAQGTMFNTLLGVAEQGGSGLDGNNAYSPHALILQDEIMSYTKRILRSCEISPETLAVNAIAEVATGKKEYVSAPHTLKHLRSEERLRSKVFSYVSAQRWFENPTTLMQKTDDYLTQIKSGHEVPPLDDHVLKEIDDIVKAADKELT